MAGRTWLPLPRPIRPSYMVVEAVEIVDYVVVEALEIVDFVVARVVVVLEGQGVAWELPHDSKAEASHHQDQAYPWNLPASPTRCHPDCQLG